jgi:hypothetical protein
MAILLILIGTYLLVAIFGYYKLYYDYWCLFYYNLLLDILGYIIT